MKKIVCVLISMLLVLLTSVPAFAYENDRKEMASSSRNTDSVVEDISFFKNTVVYYFSNDVLRDA